MSHPLLDEFCRASGLLRPEFYRRCQRVFSAELKPLVEEVETLRTDNADLRAKLSACQERAARRKAEAVS